jgi:autotransporter translocation and assembly factor TamB
MRATGTFDVNLLPLTLNDEDPTRARFSINKQFRGDLEGTSKGEMLSAGTDVKGSAGYVAIERVSGTLHGKSGSFALQHSGTMNRGVPSLLITIVPDSGTGELAGIAGTFTIDIAAGGHSYQLEYTLGELN